MDELNLHRIKRQLFLGGIAPKTIARLTSELATHFDDLKAQAIAEGKPELDAQSYACNAIGDETTLVSSFLAKQELKSYCWRYPKIIFVAGPVLLLLSILAVIFFAVVGMVGLSSETMNLTADSQISSTAKTLFQMLMFFNCYLLTPLLAAGFCIIAKNRAIAYLWPLVGVLILAVLGSGFAYSITWPSEITQGSISVNWGYSFLPRYIRGDHDLKNTIQILSSILLFVVIYWTYNPHRNYE